MRGDLDRLAQRVGLGRQRTVDVQIEPIFASFALDVVDVDMHLRAVAEFEEARQRRGDDNGVAHDHVRLGRADLALGPGDRHHADRAVEAGNIEADVGDAVGADLDDAGKQRERRLRRQIAFEAAAAVAAAVQRAGGALHAVDQEAVEVANVHASLRWPKK